MVALVFSFRSLRRAGMRKKHITGGNNTAKSLKAQHSKLLKKTHTWNSWNGYKCKHQCRHSLSAFLQTRHGYFHFCDSIPQAISDTAYCSWIRGT